VKHAAMAFSSVAFCLNLLLAGVVAAQSAPPRKDIPAIAKAANGVIVSIITSDKDGHPVAQGTGFLVSKDGRIVTNYHVIKGASSAIVKLPDGAFYDVDGVVAFDKARDLAVIKAHGQNFRVVTLGNSDRVQVGEEIVAIGSPLSLESTVSSGIVSGIRTIKEEGGKFLQITAPISPGSSGGPLFNMAGEVVGITTLYLKGGENLNFAIPVNDAKLLLSTGSKVQDFPVETVVAKSEAHAEAAPSPSVSPTAARAYYKQFYDTGKLDGLIPTLVCFDDDPKNSQDFFTLEEEVYNERYAKSANAHVENLKKERSGEVVDDTEAWQTMRSIEASEPDVFFIDDNSLALTGILYGTDPQEYLRGGGRVMLFGSYVKGVAPSIDSVFRWSGPGTGNSWFRAFPPPRPDIKAGRLLLQVDPTTRRYRMGDELTFADGTSLHEDQRFGTCEKIPAKPSASNTKERSEDAYVITAHTVIHDENTNSQLDNYVIVHGAEVLTVQYAESQISTAKLGKMGSSDEYKPDALELEQLEKNLHLHMRYRSWPQEPDVSQVPQVGAPIRACEMDTNYPGSVEHPAIAIQSITAPCMSRDGDTLHYSIAPNGGMKMFEYVNFDILSETVSSGTAR
jgi:hypothetical protein